MRIYGQTFRGFFPIDGGLGWGILKARMGPMVRRQARGAILHDSKVSWEPSENQNGEYLTILAIQVTV